jgi:hypothetical protein
MAEPLPRLYSDLATWFHLLTPPAEYVEEAEIYRRVFVETAVTPPRTLLEPGSGGGNTASHDKRHFRSTLVDPSPPMLAEVGFGATVRPLEHSEIPAGSVEHFVAIKTAT